MEYLLTHLLQNSASAHSAKEAVRSNGAALTYEELEDLTNQVAQTLITAGVRRGDRVGLYVHKSLASVIGVFGIMKAGAAYVPLDPNAPVKRLAYITRDCGIQVLLTAPGKMNQAPGFFVEGTPIRTIVMLEQSSSGLQISECPPEVKLIYWNQVQQANRSCPVTETIESDLAYILYTSGSTGVPKGVMISHRTILTFIRWCQKEFQMSAEDRVTSHAPLHFDLSTFDIYATVKAGGTIVLIPETLAALPVQIADLLENERVTITYLVPSILSMMVSYGKLAAHNFEKLRILLFAGEVFPIKYLRRLVNAIPHPSYYNLYGPTETNVCTFYKVTPADLAPEVTQPVPIGRACDNMEVFAVKEDGTLVAEPGEEGELLARGSCVAQGYWGDQAKTAKAFVQNPFNKLYPDIVYRTGDIVTMAPDRQNWLYIGRRDHMIKSRGYRIELGEIENAFYRHEEVKEAVVIAVADEIIGNRLRAYVALVENSRITVKDLETFCLGQVPKYMVPERIVLMAELPKTSTGKINRTALAQSDHATSQPQSVTK